MRTPRLESCALITLTLLLCLANLKLSQALQDLTPTSSIKRLGFNEPDTGIRFNLEAHNVNQTNKIKSVIKVFKIRLNRTLIQTNTRPQLVQVLDFSTTLVDFDLDCTRKYCYLVTVTNKNRHNVDLYIWTRTQFDLSQTTSSFSTPHAVRIFSTGHSNFYIAIAQDQLQLYSRNLVPVDEDEGLPRFFGCAIIKFTVSEDVYQKRIQLKYHQFIPLRFHPLSVEHLISFDQDKQRFHYLIFSRDPKWQESSHIQSHIFLWSPLDDLFWPFRLPKAVLFERRPFVKHPILIFPEHNNPAPNQTSPTKSPDSIESIESCFSRLQRLLFHRDLAAKQLIEAINPLWRAISPNGLGTHPYQHSSYSNISTRVIVHGDVIVQGTLISGPQLSIVGPQGNNFSVSQNSPEVIDGMLHGANLKLQSLHDKLKHAFLPSINSIFRSPIRFLRKVETNSVSFTEGIKNINVRLNNISFKKLRDDLVILDGAQDIMSKVTFRGKVFADSLEIHGRINEKYFLRDALDIASDQVQVIELFSTNNSLPYALQFNNVTTPELVMNYNSSFNNIRLSEFITRDARVQTLNGRKHFRFIEASKLDVDNQDVLLNDVNIARLATQAIKLNSPREQVLFGRYQTFTKPVHVNRLIINNNINHRINISSLIRDSLKTYDVTVQQISGFKHFKTGLSINQLTTEGQVNGIQMDQVFNLNPSRPQPDSSKMMISPFPSTGATSLASGTFNFHAPVVVVGNLKARLVNGVDLTASSVRRFPIGEVSQPPQVVRGHKSFFRTLRVNELSVLNDEQLNIIHDNRSLRQSHVNGFNVPSINSLIENQIKNPPTFDIGTMYLYGNLDLAPNHYLLGNKSMNCPLNAIRSRQILAGHEDQMIEIPVKVETLKAHQANLIPGALNGLSFPQDLVLKSYPNRSNYSQNQVVFGNKILNHLIIGQTLAEIQSFTRPTGPVGTNPKILLGSGASINGLSFRELESFINHERHKNFTGETVYQSLLIRGNIIAKHINGHRWPDDIMLKSVAGSVGPLPFPQVQRRIYSPVVFMNSSLLQVGHLDLKGPIHLDGLLNQVNLTDFGRNSATYGDKDLLSLGRPLRNKIFAAGINVVNEIRSSGQIDGIDIDEMVHKVVTIGPNQRNVHIISPKSFISDVSFEGPTNINYLNDIPLTPFLKQVLMSNGEQIKVIGRKTIAGVLRINRELDLAGTVNQVDLAINTTYSTRIPEERYRRNFTVIPPRMLTPAPYALPTPRMHSKRELPATNHLDKRRAHTLANRNPIAIRYETSKYMDPQVELIKQNGQLKKFIDQLKSQIISLQLIKRNLNIDHVVGFVESETKDISNFHLPNKDDHYLENIDFPKSFLPLDQLKFAFLKSTIYYMSVGVTADPFGHKTTGVYFSVGGSEIRQLFTLPMSYPNSALFVKIADQSTVFLLVSQDYQTVLNKGRPQCSMSLPSRIYNLDTLYCNKQADLAQISGGVHIYLFNALLNSSSLTSAYFDLYQTISLPAIDSFEQFQYGGSTYVIAASRLSGQIHLLLLRGYSGFQVASSIDEPMLENVKILHTAQGHPNLLVYLTNGDRKIMEPVFV